MPSSTDRIEMHIDLDAPPARVWRVLSDHSEFGSWFGVKLESAFVPGKASRGKITHPGYEHLTMEIVIRAMEPERLLSFNWHPYAVDPNVDYSKETPTLVEFTLEPISTGTRLTVVESGFDKLPASRRDEAFRMNSGGWAAQLENIEKYLSETR